MIQRKVWYALSVALISCTAQPEFLSPKGYNLNAPEKIFMKENLLEISGIAFHHENADTVFSINDEEGRMYTLPLGGKRSLHTRFARNGDYEDIGILDETVYILRSDGTLMSFPLDSAFAREKVTSVSHHVLPKGEYEGLYADEPQHKLYVLCKSCGKEKDELLGHVISVIADTLKPGEIFHIALPQAKEKKRKNLLPSALAHNSITREWFILSSVQKTLWVTDSLWNVKDTYALDPKIFIQPEGMVFDHDQNLYISNEGNEIHNGTILKFPFHQN